MAATLTTQAVFEAFLGDYAEFKTFFHGHSYTGNQLGAAAALANMELLETPGSIAGRKNLEQTFQQELQTLWALPNVGDVRQVGLIAGVELVKDWRTRAAFEPSARVGMGVCHGKAGCAHSSHRKCGRADAALLHNDGADANDGERVTGGDFAPVVNG
jgi:adenosylmethionine-8-amino-7-oxononanoate aminotransferase